jgi:hypothetical protein
MDCIKLYDIGLSPQYHPKGLNTIFSQKRNMRRRMMG